MRNTIRIATCGLDSRYQFSLVPQIIESVGYKITWSQQNSAELVIFGPFHKNKIKNRWAPRKLRPGITAIAKKLSSTHQPLTLFQTGENLRHNHFECDYSLSFDLAVSSPKHCRFPYWMEMIDWKHEGITGNHNPRYGQLIKLDRLMEPLGVNFLKKPKRIAFFSSHLREPRATLLRVLNQIMPIDCDGPAFNSRILNHNESTFNKHERLKSYAFNLCPENSLYPGYYTEKIPEAFAANCLPITWTDTNVSVDFNPASFLNLAPMMGDNFSSLSEILLSDSLLKSYTNQPLIIKRPCIQELRNFIIELITMAKS